MTHATSEDIFLGRKQEDFDLAEKLLVKHGKLNTKCVREMADAVYGRMGIVECHKILQRVWNDMHVKKLEDENAELRDDLFLAQRIIGQISHEGFELIDENKKLRELASILCFCMQIHNQCDDCKLNGAKGEIAHDPLLACDGLHEKLRELGIEVPE